MGWLTSILGGKRDTGSTGEHLAAEHLKKLGYRILARNLRNRFGEVDLLAEAPDGRTIVVAEVKAAEFHNDALPPEVRVNLHKQRKLTALACQVARRYRLEDRPIRFDVIGVTLPNEQHAAQIRHHTGAFESHV